MLYLLAFVLGVAAYRWLYRPLMSLARAAVFVASIVLAGRVVSWIVPEILEVNWRGVAGGATLGLLLTMTIVGGWFYILGWRGRVSATEADDIKRAKDKAAKDRQVA